MSRDTKHGLITKQAVTPEKHERSRELRQSMTEAERLLWTQLRGGRLGGLKFRRQQVIDGFIVDFYCHSAGLVVEVDGAIHEQQKQYDIERDQVLSGRGLKVLRLSNDEVICHIDTALQRIKESCV